MWNIVTYCHNGKKMIDPAEKCVQWRVLVLAVLNPNVRLAEKMIRTSNGARTISLTMFPIPSTRFVLHQKKTCG